MIPKINHGPITKSRAVTQDFFPRSSSSGGIEFNQAPINKNQVREEAKEKVAAASNKRSAFMAKLHNEEEEEESGAFRRNGKRTGVNLKDYEDEMKVFTMGESDEEDGGTTGAKKRVIKGADKGTSASKKIKSEGAKVNRLVRYSK